MKRAFPQESVPDSYSWVVPPGEGAWQEPTGSSRRARTSFAVLGLALSVGASGSILTESDRVFAASIPTDALAAAPALTEASSLALNSPVKNLPKAAYHTVEEGESLWQIAEMHQVDISAIKAANAIQPEETIQVGQVLRVPAQENVVEEVTVASSASLPQSEVVEQPAATIAATASVGVESVSAESEFPLSLPLNTVSETPATKVASTSTNQGEVAAEGVATAAELRMSEGADRSTSSSLSVDVASEESVTASASLQLEATEPTLASASTPVSVETSEGVTTIVAPQPLEESGWTTRAVESSREAVSAPAAPVASVDGLDQATVTEPTVESTPDDQVVDGSGQSASEVSKPLHLAVSVPKVPEISRQNQPLSDGVLHSVSYQVKPGDTLWTIASRHGVETDALVQQNQGLIDPDLLAVGEVILIPQQSSTEENGIDASDSADESDELVAAVQSDSVDVATAQPVDTSALTLNPTETASTEETTTSSLDPRFLALLRQSQETPIDREALRQRIRQARLAAQQQALAAVRAESPTSTSDKIQAISSTTLDEASASGVGGPQEQLAAPDTATANLIADVRAIQQERQVVTLDEDVAVPDAASEEQLVAATRLQPTNLLETPAQEPVNPQFSPEATPEATPPVEADPQLLAAAPLGADAYQPSVDFPVGETVSPDMPILPGSDEYLPEAPSRFNGYIWPAQGVLTSGYGWRWGRMHQGVDIAGPVGTPVFAAAPGVVERSGWNSGGYGNLVDIRHPDGSMTRYAHNSRLLVQQGQQVRQGEQIAEMGSTGYSTGPHLHFEIRLPDSGAVNPIAYLPSR